MSIQFTIAETFGQAREVAVETRNALAAWVQERAPSCGVAVVQPLLADRQAELKEQGKNLFENAGRAFGRAYPLVQANDALVACIRDFHKATHSIAFDTNVREDTYLLEGIANTFSKAAFTCGEPWTPKHHWTAWSAIAAPDCTTGSVDTALAVAFFGYEGRSQFGLSGAGYRMYNSAGAMNLKDAVYTVAKMGFASDLANRGFSSEQGTHTDWRVYAVPYMDEDGPWVAGFLCPRDVGRMRFSRKRLGAWLKESGCYQDTTITSLVERAKQEQAGAKFTLYPNDCDWSDLYVGGGDEVDSCMSHGADHWELGDDPDGDPAHPVSPYSAAYWGAGDNGLVLFVAEEDGVGMIGRGIFNIHTGNIVRWYAGHTAGRALKKLGMDIDDGDALADSWLALIKIDEACQFLHPYVDGCCYHGKVEEEEGRVYLQRRSTDDTIDLEMTGGSSFIGDSHYCEDVSRNMLASHSVYQPIQGNYVTQAAIDEWTCPVTHEWAGNWNRFNVNLDGEMTEISRYARNNCIETLPYDQIPRDAERDSRSSLTDYKTRTPEWAVKELEWQIEHNPDNQQLSLDLAQLQSQVSLRASSELAARTAERANASLNRLSSSPLSSLDFSAAETRMATSSASSLSEAARAGCGCRDCQREREREAHQGLERELAATAVSYFEAMRQQMAVYDAQRVMTATYGSTVTGRSSYNSPQIQELPRARPVRFDSITPMIWEDAPQG